MGTEILRGDIDDTNSGELARWLYQRGFDVTDIRAVPDDLEVLAHAFREILSRTSLVISTGGLGPTADDVTREALALALGRDLVAHRESVKRVREFFQGRGLPMTDNNLRQAMIPQGGQVVGNARGTAPGIMVAGPPLIVCLPGPPREWKPMLEKVEPEILRLKGSGAESRVSHHILVVGLGESRTEDHLERLDLPAGLTWATYAGSGQVDLFLEARGECEIQAREILERSVCRIRESLGKHVITSGARRLEEDLVRRLEEASLTLGVAESCTGGLLGHSVTSVPGSSRVFLGGIVAYDNSVKTRVVGVKEETIRRWGAVSPQVALEMAQGARKALGSDLGVGITGIAGPGGGSREKPVGTSYIAVSGPWGEREASPRGPGDRYTNKAFFARSALVEIHLHLVDGRI